MNQLFQVRMEVVVKEREVIEATSLKIINLKSLFSFCVAITSLIVLEII